MTLFASLVNEGFPKKDPLLKQKYLPQEHFVVLLELTRIRKNAKIKMAELLPL